MVKDYPEELSSHSQHFGLMLLKIAPHSQSRLTALHRGYARFAVADSGLTLPLAED